MDRWDLGFISVGALALPAIVLLGADPAAAFGIVFAVFGFVAAAIAANHAIGRSPRLVVEYRNVNAGDRPVVWERTAQSQPRSSLHVYVRNSGRGPAENVDVRFESLQAAIYNESGNGNTEVEENFVPPRFTRREHVLNAGEEWCIAMLSWHGDARPPDATAAWRASAKGMERCEGVVRVRKLDGPPSA